MASLLALAGGVVQGGLAAAEDGGGFSPGTASAMATSYRLNPVQGGLSFGIAFGLSLSDYTNEAARAESRGADLGVIGTTLAASACDGGDPTLPAEDQPQPLRVESRDPDGAKGKTEQDDKVPATTKSAKADASPSSEAETTSLLLGVPGALTIKGARSQTITRVVDGATREAIATVDIGSIDLAGQVQLTKLHWEAVHHSGADQTVKGTFTIGSARANGQAVPIPTNDPAAAFASLNKALAPVGIELRPPTIRQSKGTLFIDPLAIGVVPSPTRDGVVNPVIGAGQPAREAIFDSLMKASCKFGSVITVLDIVVGALTGGGQFSVELGGVQATSGDVQTTHFLSQGSLGSVGAETLGGDLTGTDGVASLADGGSSLAGSAAGGATGPASGGSREQAAAGPSRPGGRSTAELASAVGKRGGALAGVGAAGLGLLALMAELDRRTIRRTARSIPFED